MQSTWDALSTIVRAEGPRGLFRGVVPTVATNAPFSALYYMFYKNLQSQFTKVGRCDTRECWPVGGIPRFNSDICNAPV